MEKNSSHGFDPIHDTQKLYRSLLDVIARPGTVEHAVEDAGRPSVPEGVSAAAAGIALTLLDGEVGFAVRLKGQEGLAAYIKRMTFSREAAVDAADYIFADGLASEKEIRSVMASAKRGTLVAPDQSATVFIRVEQLAEGGRALPGAEVLPLRLSGPGIPGEAVCTVDGLSPVWLEERERANGEYPLGVDLFLYTEAGDLTALPRTTQVKEVERQWHM
ncbi:phosphonate C-P lyase system protein PhnH [Paenibacillus hamazuiensis]|uniref:phosphonate C-P lyase system protein PhnH n=1 Tax=Paenibacillus hamazuiensis TaxID=2936508 RepID=UPI00200E5BE2|nr:phosphonate C-P lyase system protein PhnH [Paenibacillus hamazuiensis]